MSDQPPAGPVDPMSPVREGLVGAHEWDRQMRAAGWPIIAAVTYIIVFSKVNGEDPPAS